MNRCKFQAFTNLTPRREAREGIHLQPAAPANVTDLQAAFDSAVFYEAAAQRQDRSALFLLFLLD